ncbi:MAG: tRNA epoxyqueuosine(34) reductase QueG, partial [Methyloligellaceae bacterium]
GYHGDMGWLENHADRRSSPSVLWPDVRSIILLVMNYAPSSDPSNDLLDKSSGNISVYARGKDYHDIIKKKLKVLAGWFHRETGCEVKVFVDTAPVMEKPLSAAAGLGWQGKHTNLVSRQFGSWLFIGSIFTTAEIESDEPEIDHCGSCRKCLDICPTDAFPNAYELDARNCISYLTIEHKGHIGREFREPMGNRIYGCDDCLAVCPWNKFAQSSREIRFQAREGTDAPSLKKLLKLDETSFRQLFAGSPIKRTGRDRFVRNVLIASGNSQDKTLLDDVIKLLDDPSDLVRAMAVWALGRLCSQDEFKRFRVQHLELEADPEVRQEWHAQ